MKIHKKLVLHLLALVFVFNCTAQSVSRTVEDFGKSWKFYLGNADNAKDFSYNDADWRNLNLPHDWSIELPFDSTSPTGNGGGALAARATLEPLVTNAITYTSNTSQTHVINKIMAYRSLKLTPTVMVGSTEKMECPFASKIFFTFPMRLSFYCNRLKYRIILLKIKMKQKILLLPTASVLNNLE